MTATMSDDTCTHVNRMPVVFRYETIGAISTGRCPKPCVPQLNVCLEHADKDAMLIVIRGLIRDCKPKKRSRT